MGRTINTILNLQDKFSKKIDQAGKNALIFKTRLQNCEGAARSVDKFLGGMAKTAAMASAAGVAAMGAFAASCVKTYGEFQKSMSNVAGILSVDVSSEAYTKLEAAAREAGKSTTKTAAESADALSYMALAGWSVEDSIAGLEPILRASEATGADLATTSDLITDSMSALGLKTNELQHYLDVCARAQNKSNTTLTQMQEAYIGVGGTFKTFGTSLQESGALLGILANRGIKGSEAGNSLQSTLVNLTKQSGESAKAMKAIGVSAYDSEGKFKGITKVLKEVQAATAHMTEKQRNNYLTMIAGKTQLTTLNALMSGLSNTLEDGTNEFQALFDTLGDCDGALGNMADTMTNNYAGALARAGSAVDDLKITVGQKLEPYITKFLNWFSEKLPGATEKFAIWLDNKIPKAINFCKSAFNLLKPPVSFIINNFSKLASVAAGVVVGLKAFSVITKVVSFMNKLKTAETALKAVQLALNTSILACPLTWVAVAIGSVVGGFLLYKSAVEEAEKADVAAHFGDIALSAEECGRMVENVFGTALVRSVNELNGAWDRVESHFKNLSDSASDMNELTFQLKINPNNVPQEEYIETANQYVENMQKAIKGKQYELNLDIKFLFGEGSDTADILSGQSSKYWSGVLQNAQAMGDELVANIAKGYENGWDEKSMEMVAKSLQKMSEIQEKIQMTQAQANMQLLTEDFKMGDLSQESFQTYIEKLQEQGNAINEASKTSSANLMAAQKLMLDDGAISIDEYNANVKKITEAYQKKFAETSNTVLTEGINAIHEVYGKEFEMAAKQLNEDLAGEFVIDPENLQDSMLVLQDVLSESFKNAGISSGVKKDIQGYLETLMPTADELKKAATKDQSLWKVYGDTLTSVEALKSLTGSGDQMGNALISGINSSSNLMNAEKASKELKDRAIKIFSEKTKVTIPIEIKYGVSTPTFKTGKTAYSSENASDFSKASANETASRERKANAEESRSYAASTGYGQLGQAMNHLGGHATGTPYFGGGLTEINENGGEIINLPTGAQIIPSDKSERMIKEKYKQPNISLFAVSSSGFRDTPHFGRNTQLRDNEFLSSNYQNRNNNRGEKQFENITVNVNIGGNIIGLDNVADEIGEIICGKLVSVIRTM